MILLTKLQRCANALYQKMERTEKSLYRSGNQRPSIDNFEALARVVIDEYERLSV